jgi:hypothetical protein
MQEKCAHLRIMLVVVLLCANPTRHQLIQNGVRQREIVITFGRYISILRKKKSIKPSFFTHLDERKVQMSIECLLDVRHALHLRNAADADLLATFVIR